MRSRILLIFVAIMLVAGLVTTGCAAPEEERLSFHVLLPNAPTDGGWNQGYYLYALVGIRGTIYMPWLESMELFICPGWNQGNYLYALVGIR